MKRAAFLLAFAGAAPCFASDAADLAWKTRIIGEQRSLRVDSIFAQGLLLTSFGRDRARLEGEARGRAGPVSLLLTATASGQEGRRPESTLLANEAYVDFRAGADHFSIGKKILSGDVGYGFRPIDVIQREQRLQVLAPALEGVPNLAWERFSADTAWALILANPGHGRRGDAKSDGSLALRYFNHGKAVDFHGVARMSERYKLEAGFALSAVPHESLELHASFLAQRRGERFVPLSEPASTFALLAPERAIESVTLNAPRKALAGFTWTWEGGWSLIGETWWDGTAPIAGDWRTLASQAARRNALLGVPGVPGAAVAGSLAASTRLFQSPSLSRRTQFGRISWTDPSGGGWTASFDMLRTPEDGGRVATAAAGWEADRLKIEAGLRRFGGKPDSAYRLMPERGVAFAGVSLAF